MKQPKAKTTVEWHHLVSPHGESFQGFWVMRDGQPINQRPFETKKEAMALLRSMKNV